MIKRIIKAGWSNCFKDGGLFFATIFILAMTISLIGSLFLFKDVSSFLITSIQEKVDVSVYFKDTALEEDILKVKEEISEIPEVKEVKYVSKEEAFEEFTLRHEDNPVLMQALEEVGINPFLASLNIKAFEASQYQAVASFLEGAEYESLVEKVDYHERKSVIERIFSLTSNFNTIGIIFSVILAVIAVLIAFNTIRLAIYDSREEIQIQRLVGASNWFIRGPFLFQGVISGVIAALISIGLIAFVSFLISPKLVFLFSGLNLFSFFVVNFWGIFLISLVAGTGLGAVSSLIAIRKYLRV